MRVCTQSESRRKLTVFMLMVTAITVKQHLKTIISAHAKKPVHRCQNKILRGGNKKREMDELRREYIKERGYKFQEMWECEWWEHFKTDSSVNNYVKTNFPYKRPLSTDSSFKKSKNGSRLGCVQCELMVPDELKPTFSNFPPKFKNIEVCRNDTGEHMKNYAKENDLLIKPQRMLISSFKLEDHHTPS